MTATVVRSNTIPGPPPMPVLGWRGNVMQFFGDPIGQMRALYREYGAISALVRNNPALVCAFGPEYNKLVLPQSDLFYSKIFPFDVAQDTALFRLNRHVLGMRGDEHRRYRRLITPAFAKGRIETYRADMAAIVRQTLDRWPTGQPIDIDAEMQQMTTRLVSKAVFGLDITQADVANSIGAQVKRWLQMILSAPVVLFPRDLPATPYRRLLVFSERLEARIQAVIDQKRANADDQRDIFSLLIHARDEDGSRLSDTELIGHAALLFFAANDTTANALSWTLLLLTQHPPILADLVDELDAVLHGDAPTVEQSSQLPLLDWVIKESMRLLPPAAFLIRHSAAPFELGPYQCPAGAQVFLSEYMTHHLPDLYPEPESFLPRRWSNFTPTPYAYLPFGAGPHACIGAGLAMLELKLVLPLILQRYRLGLVPGVRIDRQVQVTLSPKHGLPMIVHCQDREFARGKVAVRGNIREMVNLS